ncbi:Druantia anti-phage system protein DruA [Plesiocystis pacifica]|uniref:Druantia anti-phage system protein DruA n=1 Tax=Plesiocystis pacifica TaxID=191768 RepID=UPI000A313FAF|nr:Druantia anti-phage system protein DruA [Plesiocystis pacifica]
MVAQTVRYSPKIKKAAYTKLTGMVRAADGPLQLQASLIDFAEGARSKRQRAAALVLADLVRQGWDVHVRDKEIWSSSIGGATRSGERAEEAKARVQETLKAFRAVQLSEASVNKFLRGMERPRVFEGRTVSVLNLVDDGHDLALTLADVSRVPPSDRPTALREVIHPIIQVATPDDRCEHTGLSLYDVWRYFRHTWSLEYRTTPGRSLAFLVRNAARPMAPVIGIASIANAALQLKVRDDWIGWSTHGVLSTLSAEPERWPQLRRAMNRTLGRAVQQIRSDDLLEELRDYEGAELEERLRVIGAAAREERTRQLQDRSQRQARGEEVESLHALPLDEDGNIDWVTASERALFTRKRAETLADLLFAQRVLAGLPTRGRAVEGALQTKDARRALTIAAREIRKVGLSSRLLDVNVCGAAPPYRELLGGKLVALAMASEEVSDAYRQRYRGRVSEIASQVAGAPVRRTPEICLLTTTSLYGAVSSQYNRLRAKLNSSTGEPLDIRWRDLGRTEGWGTTHFSEKTVTSLRRLVEDVTGGRNVNNVFGEGQSPRMRQVREGLAILGLDVEVYLKHRHARRVYGLELASDARSALLLNRKAAPSRPTFDEIAKWWSTRWLSRRVNDERVRARVAVQGPASVKLELTPPDLSPQLGLFDKPPPTASKPLIQWSGVMKTQSKPELIQSLYRDRGACADHHSDEVVRVLHIETAVDGFVKKWARGRVLFVTGNPGDGKTHLLKHLSKKLKSARVDVCLDANELSNERLIEMINKAARSRTRGLALAINEGILVQLVRDAEDTRWAAPVRRQLLYPLVYGDADDELEDDRFLVIDLNHRNNLASVVVEEAIRRQLQLSGPCASCPGAEGCSLQANASRLAGAGRPVERIARLLAGVADVGVHATMRELQGFIAFMLTCDESCATSPRSLARYWVNAFDGGDGPLFDALRRFDPAKMTHPLLDDKLWREADRDDEWSAGLPAFVGVEASLEDRLESFEERKRRALFEHVDGDRLLTSTSQIDEELRALLEADASALRRVVRQLNRFYDRDEEADEHLHLWMTHRYDARPPRYAASSATVPRARLELLRPRLRAPLNEAFPDHQPDHVVLAAKSGRARLRIDRALVEALLAAERGLPSTFRRGEPEARIDAFISELADAYGDPSKEDQVVVRLVDRDTGGNVQVSVDLRGRSFVKG